MACGIHLGMLLICLVQAEHARCSWVKQAQGSQRRNSDAYVGFSRQDGTARGPGHLQNKFRRPPVSVGPASLDGSRDWTQTYSRVAPQSSSGSEAGLTSWQRVKVQKAPGAQFLDRFAPISAGSSVSHHSDEKTSAVQQDAWPLKKYLFGNGSSIPSPPSEKYPFTPDSQPPVQRLAETPAHVGADTSPGARPLACGLGRRASRRHRYGSSNPSRFPPPPDAGPREKPDQQSPQRNPGFPSQGSWEPSPNCASHSPDWPHRQSGAYNRSPNKHGQLGPASTTTSSGQVSWTKGDHGQLLSESSSRRAGSSAQGFVANRTFKIPQYLGGYTIRRRTGSGDEQGPSILEPQRPAAHKPWGQRVRWYRVKLPH